MMQGHAQIQGLQTEIEELSEHITKVQHERDELEATVTQVS